MTGLNKDSTSLVERVSSAVLILTILLALFLFNFERFKYGISSNGLIFSFLGLLCMFSYLLAYYGMHNSSNFSKIHTIVYCALLTFTFIMILCDCDASQFKKGEEECPAKSASILSRLNFWWITSLIFKANRKQPVMNEKSFSSENFYALDKQELAENLSSSLEKRWEQAQK